MELVVTKDVDPFKTVLNLSEKTVNFTGLIVPLKKVSFSKVTTREMVL